MTRKRSTLADQLLDAQVEYLLGELSGEKLAETVSRDVDDALKIAEKLTVAEVLDRDRAKAVARKYVALAGDSAVIELLAKELAQAVYQLAAADDHKLGEVIGREHVEALVDKVLSMHTLRDRLLERLADSPVVASVASWFVNKIVTDFLQHNQEIAERVPGVGALLSVGKRAVQAARGQADRHLGQVIGDVAGRGAQYALRRLTKVIKESAREAPLHDAAMEVWDLQAEEPVSALREYLTEDDLRELVEIIHELWLTLRETEYFGAALDAGVDVLFDYYGRHTVGELLAELGIRREDLATDLREFLTPLVTLLVDRDLLEPLIRARLEPFFGSDRVAALLA